VLFSLTCSLLQLRYSHGLYLIFAGEDSLAEVQIPPVELVDVASLKTDGQNPNKMSEKQHKALRESILKYGFVVPIITNKDLLIADGEQRWLEAKALGMRQVQIIRLPVEDVDRRLLRQVLNKLKGEHEPKADAEEFQQIVDAGREEDLKRLLLLSDQSLDRSLKRLQDEEEGMTFKSTWEVVVECESEKQQEATYKKLVDQGFKCRVLTL
jgi:ParB-like chromosome segregation protein Spo0J